MSLTYLKKTYFFLRQLNNLVNLTANLLGQFPLGKLHPGCPEWHEQFDCEVDNLDPTEDGEAGEEPHGAADEAELGLQGHLHISLYLVVGRRVEVDLDQLQGGGLDGVI